MSRKPLARAYHKAVSEYDEETVARMVDENYIQHNPRVPTGRAAFIALLPKLKAHGSKIENIRMLEDGPYVIMQHRWKNATPFGADEMSAFHIIRFDENGLIAEHWSVMDSKAARIEGEMVIKDLEETDRNKARIVALFKDSTVRQHKVFGEGNFVLSISEGIRQGKPFAFYDLYLLDRGVVIDQWNISQEIPLENLANDNGMFNFT